MQCPFLYQYRVRPTQENEQKGKLAGAIATVLVFAESYTVGCARSRRFIFRNHWEIEKLLRVMVMCPHHINHFDSALKKAYLQAEHFGIAACFDGWLLHPHV